MRESLIEGPEQKKVDNKKWRLDELDLDLDFNWFFYYRECSLWLISIWILIDN
jgi:hypothetical protein